MTSPFVRIGFGLAVVVLVGCSEPVKCTMYWDWQKLPSAQIAECGHDGRTICTEQIGCTEWTGTGSCKYGFTVTTIQKFVCPGDEYPSDLPSPGNDSSMNPYNKQE